MKKLKCASFFAGVGGIDIGFENTGHFEIVYANEYDSYPVKTYELNAKIKVDNRSIENVQPSEIPDFDVFLGGFPYQSFSIVGKQKGFEDGDNENRGTLFFEIIRILKAKQPKIVFLENVKHLVSHDNGNTFSIILKKLNEIGYNVKFKVLNTMEYGNIPQNRERLYMVCYKDIEEYKNFEFPKPIPLTTKLDEIIDFTSKIDEKYYYTKDKYKGNIYEKLIEEMDDPNAVYQWRRIYVRKNKSGVIPTITANQGMGGHNVCLVLTKYGIRKMTPRECFNAQGFPNTFVLPSDMSAGKLYCQAGNSVSISVITRIANCIYEAVKK